MKKRETEREREGGREGETLERKSKRRKERERVKEQKERSDLLKRNAWELNHVAPRTGSRNIALRKYARIRIHRHTYRYTYTGQECYVQVQSLQSA